MSATPNALRSPGARKIAGSASHDGFLPIERLRAFSIVAVAIGLVVSVVSFLARGSLWEDELIAITHTNTALPRLFIEVLRNDIHPPLYFVQLDAWLAVGGPGDRWALANSLAWGWVSLVVMFFVARRIHGARAAWFAVALSAVLPTFAWSASTLRMYSAVPACVLVAYLVNRRWFETRRTGWLVLTFVVEVLLAYVHAIEFFFVAFIVFGTFAEALSRKTWTGVSNEFRMLWPWLLVQLLFAVSVLPLAASALLRGSDASAPGSAAAALIMGGALVAGWKTSGIVAIRVAGMIIFGALAIAGLSARDGRVRTLAIPLLTLIVAAAIGLWLKPIFKQPVFAANLLPFLVLGAAAGAARWRVVAAAVGACIVVLAIAAFPFSELQRQGEAYEAAARMIRQNAVPGDLVVVPNVSVYWGIARYAVGPRWGDPLATMPAPNAEWSRLNAKLASWFGVDAPRHLGLVPDRDFVVSAGVRYLIGGDAVAASETAPHVWVVTRDRYDVNVHLDPRLIPSTVIAPTRFGGDELLVDRFDRPTVTGS